MEYFAKAKRRERSEAGKQAEGQAGKSTQKAETSEKETERQAKPQDVEVLQENDCSCSIENSSCLEESLLAYKCYLLNRENIGMCKKEIQKIIDCRKSKNSTVKEASILSRMIRYLLNK